MSNASNSVTEPLPQTPEQPPRPRRRWWRQLLVTLVAAMAVAGGILWWQERQLSAASAALERGDTKYAMYLVTRYLRWQPNDPRALALQARGFVKMGLAEEAIRVFDAVGAATAEELHALANAFMLQEEWSSAQPLLMRLVEMKPNDSDAWYELTSCRMRLSRFDEALDSARRFIEVSGQQARGEVLIGSIYGAVRNQREAAKAFARVLEREPEAKNLQISPGEFFLRYGRVLMDLGQPQEALEPLKRAAAEKETGEVFVLLGDAAAQLGQPEHALLAWRKALEVEPNNAAARTNLANAAMLAGNGQEALQWLEPLREGPQSSTVTYLFQRAYTLLGDEAQAAQWLEKTAQLRRDEHVLSVVDNAMVSNPEGFWSRVAKAHYFAAEGNWREAEIMVTKLVEEAPGEPFVIELAAAIRRKSELPSLTRIPVAQF